MLTQFLKKQLDNYLLKNQPNVALFTNLMMSNATAESTDSRSVYSN